MTRPSFCLQTLQEDGWSRREPDSSEVSQDDFFVGEINSVGEEASRQAPPAFYPALPLISGSTFLLSQHLDLRGRPRDHRIRAIGAHPDSSSCCTETDER